MGDVGVENANEKDDTDTGVGRGRVWQSRPSALCFSDVDVDPRIECRT